LTATEFNKVVDQWADNLYRFALSMAKDDDIAKDVVQDCFAKFWEKKDQVDPKKVKSYLFTSAHNRVIDVMRKSKRVQTMEAIVEPPSVRQESHDLNEVLHEALNTLSEIQKSVILLRDYEGYNYEEIADMTNLSLAQVKVYIFRGRQKLKRYIGSMDMVI